MELDELKVFAGPGNSVLGIEIAAQLGVPPGRMYYTQFPDGENYVRFDESVRGADSYIIQPTCPPVDTNLVVLLEAIDALRRASSRRITPVIPYYGYARQERRSLPREAIMAKVVADMLGAAGADRVMCLDLHADAIQGFFNIPVDHLTALNLFSDYFAHKLHNGLDNVVLVSPDEGRVKKVREVAQTLETPLAVGYKHRQDQHSPELTHLAGEVKGKIPVIIEDMITTGGSILNATDALLEHGCKPEIYVAATHGVLVSDAAFRICSRPEIRELIITDSVPLSIHNHHPKIKVLSVASLFAEAIRRANSDESISSLFVRK